MSKHRTRRVGRLTQRSTYAQLESWLRSRNGDAVNRGTIIRRARLIRTSGRSREAWKASAETSFASIDKTLPDVAQALALGFDLIRNDAIGVTTRSELGDSVFVLRRGHAPGGKGEAQIGLILHVGETLFLYLLTSARANDIKGATADRGSNAFTEVLSTVVRHITDAGRSADPTFRPEVHAREHGRFVRSEKHGAALKETFIRCKALVFKPQEVDLTDPAAQQAFSFGSLMEDSAVNSLIKGMNRPEVIMQADGAWYEGHKQIPFTHQPARTVETDSRTGRTIETIHKHRLTVADDLNLAKTILRSLVDEVLKDKAGTRGVTDWEAVGAVAAGFGLPSRRPEDAVRDVLLSDLPPASQGRAGRNLLQKNYIDGWRHGSFLKDVKIKTALDLELDGVEIVTTADGDYYRCKIDFPLPEGGWGITDEEWDLVLKRRYPQTEEQKAARRAATTGERLPFAGVIGWDDTTTGTQWKLQTKKTYGLHSRPLDEAYVRGLPVGWERTTMGPSHATLRPALLHTSVGKAMEAALLALDSPAQETSMPVYRAVSATESTADRARKQIQEAEEDLTDAEDQLAGAEDENARAAGRVRKDPSDTNTRTAKRARATLERAQSRVVDAEQRLAQANKLTAKQTTKATSSEHEVESATAEFTAVALQKCVESAPPWLNQACGYFLTDWTMTPVSVPGRRPSVDWSCNLVLADPETGTDVLVPLSGNVANTAHDGTTRGRKKAEAMAWAFLYDGQEVADIAEAAGLTRSSAKNSYAYSEIRRVMSAVVTDSQLLAAAMDHFSPAARRVLWAAVSDQAKALHGIDPGFAKHIKTTYTGVAAVNSWSLCRGSFFHPRAVAGLLKAAGGSMTLPDLTEASGLSAEDIMSLTRGGSNSPGSTATKQIAYFTKNFSRGGTPMPMAERVIRLRECPHEDCPDRLRGNAAWCTIILRLPETEAGFGVLCPTCRRCPVQTMSKVRFPADYLRPWSGRFGRGSHAAGRKSDVRIFLQPGLRDPGPAAPLPDVGCLPREDTTIRERSPRAKRPDKAQKSRPLRGRRVYVDPRIVNDERRELAEHITTNGGDVAIRLNKSVLVYVHPGDKPHGEHLAWITKMKIPTANTESFYMREPSSWVAS
ncbi:hypothetical protein IFT73_13835 [Aeromicrobium sp. CFBP 8757]|uniref:hypothetical protein n=1 Tax=Aeromicrobium sp. CFBP 8757 TaxID=2775288 RepID=UPI00177B11BF|nr:hypothetical protein [Aeromicrobium sp. CFBP 8757]MBD8607938.1 hypothetical protein [Aeromicrobium sp. CFBP 8757]